MIVIIFASIGNCKLTEALDPAGFLRRRGLLAGSQSGLRSPAQAFLEAAEPASPACSLVDEGCLPYRNINGLKNNMI